MYVALLPPEGALPSNYLQLVSRFKDIRLLLMCLSIFIAACTSYSVFVLLDVCLGIVCFSIMPVKMLSLFGLQVVPKFAPAVVANYSLSIYIYI